MLLFIEYMDITFYHLQSIEYHNVCNIPFLHIEIIIIYFPYYKNKYILIKEEKHMRRIVPMSRRCL